MEEKPVEMATSYRALYRVRPIIYQIGDMKLWMPIQRDGIVLWFFYLAVFFVFYFVFPIFSWFLPLDPLVGMIVGPIVLAYWSVKLDPAGKTVPTFLWDLACFMVKPKWFVNWDHRSFHSVRGQCRFSARWRDVYRSFRSGMEQVEAGGGKTYTGQVKNLVFFSLTEPGQIVWREKSGRLFIQTGTSGGEESHARQKRVPVSNKKVRLCTTKNTEVFVEPTEQGKVWHVVTKGGNPM